MSLLHGVGAGLGGSGDAGGPLGSFYSHTINQSLRVNGSNKSLSRTVGSSVTNRKKFTISGWVKPTFSTGLTSTASAHMWAGYGKNGGTYGQLGFYADDLYYYDYNYACYLRSTQLFLDRSAWYHIVLIVDTTQSTAADRNIVYVNGTQITAWDTQTNYSLNHDTNYNVADSATNHFVGTSGNTGGAAYQWFEGYIAEFHFVDGTAVAISNWGETKDGVWVAKEYSGSHGDNGYYLPFDDTSAIGDDESANTNDFTSNNLVASDVVPDSPTNNFATANVLARNTSSPWTTSEGNLKILSSSNNKNIRGTILMQSGKWYWETRRHNANPGSAAISDGVGIALASGKVEDNPYQSATNWSYYSNTGNKYNNNSSSSYGDSWNTAGDIIGVAFDADNGAIWFSKNGTWQNSATASEIAAGTTTNAAYTGLTDVEGYVCNWWRTGGTNAEEMDINFGQNPSFNAELTGGDVGTESGDGSALFKYAPPTSFLALCSSNLPDPTIGPGQDTQADDNFNIVLYTGNNTDDTGITGVGFSPSWTWIKRRDGTAGHQLYDTVRGATKRIQSSSTDAESTQSTGLKSFDSDGFTLGTLGGSNGNTETFVAWNWKAGDTPTADNSAGNGATPTAGSVKIDGSNLGSALAGSLAATRLSANTTAGFSIVIYDASGVSSGTVAHGLTVAPDIIIAKPRDFNGTNWFVQVPDVLANTHMLNLETTGSAYNPGYNHFNDTVPTDEVFSFGGYMGGHSDGSGNDLKIAYCFHSVKGYSKIGTYKGNSSATDGAFVYTGFRPAFVLGKVTSQTGRWWMYDSVRSPKINYAIGTGAYLAANSTGDEAADSGANAVQLLSNGFKVNTSNSEWNGSGNTYIYLAFAEAPFKFSNAR